MRTAMTAGTENNSRYDIEKTDAAMYNKRTIHGSRKGSEQPIDGGSHEFKDD